MVLEGILRQIVEHPKRGWIVITATFVIGVVFTWPAADYYFAAASNHRQLIAEVEEGTTTAGRLGLYQKQLQQQTEKLGTLQDRAFSGDRIESFRNQLTEWVKASGCQLRRVKLADPQLRTWYEDDHPLETKVRTDKDGKTRFKLRQQSLNLLVTGPMDRVSDFLARLGEQELLLHTGNLLLRRNTENPQSVELDVDLILFDLVQGDAQSN